MDSDLKMSATSNHTTFAFQKYSLVFLQGLICKKILVGPAIHGIEAQGERGQIRMTSVLASRYVTFSDPKFYFVPPLSNYGYVVAAVLE